MRLINAKLFALGAGSTVSDAVLLLMYAQIALIALCLILFAIFMLRKYLIKKRSNEMLVAQTVAEKKEHTLIGISLFRALNVTFTWATPLIATDLPSLPNTKSNR